MEVRILAAIIMKASTQALEQHLNTLEVPISALQFGMMRLLQHHAFTMSELSRKMLLDPSTLVPSIDSLVQKGYLVRERDFNDRRRIPLKLTESGISLMERTKPVSDADPLPIALMQMGEAESEQFLGLLRQVVHNLPGGEAMLQQVLQRVSPHLSNDEC